jgi:signal transduction histidine kinase
VVGILKTEAPTGKELQWQIVAGGIRMSLKDYKSYQKEFIGIIIIFILMYLGRLFIGPPQKIGLNLLIWGSYSGLVFIPKSWWTRKRFIIAAVIISIESAIGLVWYQETKLIYYLAIIVISSIKRLSLSKSSIPVMVVIVMMAVLYMQQSNHMDLFHFLSFILFTVVVYLGLWSRMQRHEMYEMNKRHLVELQEAYDQLQETSVAAMHNAVLEERTRIAREIHDALGHSLTSLIVQMQALRYMIKKDPAQAEQSLEEMLVLARQGLQDIRTSVHALAEDRSRSGVIPLKALLSRMKASAAIQFQFHSDLKEEEVSFEICGILFRVLQEAITNVIRHSKATHVDVNLNRAAGNIVMSVRDNGRLESSENFSEGFGLKVMKARLKERGGRLRYLILEPHGFEIIAEIPVIDRARHNDDEKDG